jgi:hypothetical protein
MAPDFQPSSLAKSIESELAIIPVSSLPRIPQSTMRPSFEGMPKMNPLYSATQATPTRKATPGFLQTRGDLSSAPEQDYHEYLPSSPLHVRRSSAQLFPAVPGSAAKGLSAFLSYGVQETPVKPRQEIVFDHSHPGLPWSGNDKENNRKKEGGMEMGTSSQDMEKKEENIYKSLGWDDADDIDGLA